MTDEPKTRPVCFIAMPVSTSPEDAVLYGDDHHWKHIMEEIFVPAVEAAGFEAKLPVSRGSGLIHADIIRALVESDMVLCDFSQHNPNVLFELGVRTAVNKPVSLVKDERVTWPFDLSGINTHVYDSNLYAWFVKDEVAKLKAHITESVEKCKGANPLWQTFGLLEAAAAPSVDGSPTDAKLDLLMRSFDDLLGAVASARQGPPPEGPPLTPSDGPTPPQVRTEMEMFYRTARAVLGDRLSSVFHSGGRGVTVLLRPDAVESYNTDDHMRLRKALAADWELRVGSAEDLSRSIQPRFPGPA